ncbi:MAG TPA: CBS domain-containing protein [Stellaceae bacterium]|nr:CBS domain-containing protein [Stellaceae bacterium]
MRAIDVMVRDVISVHPDTQVTQAVELLTKHDISALPVVNGDGELVGILSEADLIHRVELGTERVRPRWLEAVTGASTLAEEFAKSHGKTVSELMTSDVVSVSEETPVSEIASLLERKRIKRVPVTRDGKLVGIVSRSNLIQALASAMEHGSPATDTDARIRRELLDRLGQQSWTGFGDRNITVHDGTVHLWGLVGSEEEHRALLALAENVPGVVKVADETFKIY